MIETVEARILKLLAVARDNRGNENESAVALELAQKLADAHNLELSSVSAAKQGRDDRKINKGLYPYQRTLYEQLAGLNHCRYWFEKGLTKGSAYEIRLLGSKVNVATTKHMADYIEDVANRLVKEIMVPLGHHYFSKASHEFRDGLIERVVIRLRDRRREEEAERRRHNEASGGVNQLVLIEDVKRREEEANFDYLYGEGAWAKAQAKREESAKRWEQWLKEQREADEALKRDNPEEWQRRKDEEQREAEKLRKKYERQAERERNKPSKYDSDHYWRGSSAGEKVNLDRQIDGEKRKAIG